nr:Clp protease N-terminal domain-containing protein [Thermomonospora catenispora]
MRLKHNCIGTGHILLGLVHDADQPACRLLWEAGADLGELRVDLERRIAAEAA